MGGVNFSLKISFRLSILGIDTHTLPTCRVLLTVCLVQSRYMLVPYMILPFGLRSVCYVALLLGSLDVRGALLRMFSGLSKDHHRAGLSAAASILRAAVGENCCFCLLSALSF